MRQWFCRKELRPRPGCSKSRPRVEN